MDHHHLHISVDDLRWSIKQHWKQAAGCPCPFKLHNISTEIQLYQRLSFSSVSPTSTLPTTYTSCSCTLKNSLLVTVTIFICCCLYRKDTREKQSFQVALHCRQLQTIRGFRNGNSSIQGEGIICTLSCTHVSIGGGSKFKSRLR